MNQIQFSISPTTHPYTGYKSGGIDDICTPGYAEHWLMEEGFVVTPTSDETQDFWKNYLAMGAEIKLSGHTGRAVDLLEELDDAEVLIGFWEEHFACKYFYGKTTLAIRRGIKSDAEMDRYTTFSQHDETYARWHGEFGFLSDEELEEEIQCIAGDHQALSQMLKELHDLQHTIMRN